MSREALIDIADIIIRSFTAVIVLFILTRIMGKKQVSQLTFFDYIVGISIGSVAAVLAVDNTIVYSHGIASMVIWAIFPLLLSYISMKSIPARKLLDGKPTIIVQNGKLIEDNLKKIQLNINDVLEELRLNGAFNIADVEFAILETSGKVSVQFKSQKQPVTPSDLNIPTGYQGLSANVIIDGQIMHENLSLLRLDENWLIGELKKQNVSSSSEVLLASLDTNGKLHIDKKSNNPPPMDVLQ